MQAIVNDLKTILGEVLQVTKYILENQDRIQVILPFKTGKGTHKAIKLL